MSLNLSRWLPSKPARQGSQERQWSGLPSSLQPNVEKMKRFFDRFDALLGRYLKENTTPYSAEAIRKVEFGYGSD
ncbi:hypothetical protein IFM89_034992 [Coptis chinensis]|uniref:Uncharacterized protein n=1 Tax=Coptis chinensis TaxID=261450 RepID=A0A835IV71_9MAGN|nr:hypothetical protein IFM89_034992 [Coptis chinensis]